MLYLGIDGGGSKTSVVVVDGEMSVLGRGVAGPSNHLRVGLNEASRELERGIAEAVKAAGVSIVEIEYAYAGIAGSDHPRHRANMVEVLRVFFPKDNFTVDSDARIALTAGVGFGAGIVIIAGTGSVAFGRNQRGQEARAGGWGPTIGDEGSGYSIARRGLSAVARAFDGRGPVTELTDLLCSRFDMCDPEDLPYFVYAPSTHADDIAACCRVVFEAARDGDPVAATILAKEGEELGTTIMAVARRLKMLAETFPVATVGGAFGAGELLLAPLRKVLDAEAPGASLTKPVETPAEGAARMAIKAAREPRPARSTAAPPPAWN
jgi:N-acetylglucosamine kinase-like BadF-type ATPase